MHSQTFDCRNFLAHRQAHTGSKHPRPSAAHVQGSQRLSTSISRSGSSFGFRNRVWGGPCPRLATRPMLRQLCRTTRRLKAVYFCPYDTIRQSCVKELLHRDLKRAALADMKQSNLGSFFGSKSKPGDGKVS